MDEAIYLSLFVNPTTKEALKSNILELIIDWYCGKMLEISKQANPLLKATEMMTLLKNILFSYRVRNEVFTVIDNLGDLGYMLDLYVDNNNGHSEVKNFGKWRNPNKKYAVMYKETSFLYPTEQGISGFGLDKGY